MLRRSIIASCTSLALLASALTAAEAQTQTIRVIVPYGPGGAPDTVARALADHIARTHNVTIVVENRPGAGSLVATEAVARMAGDGNTLLMTASAFLANPHMRNTKYDALKDFTPICNLVTTPAVLAVSDKSPYKSLEDLIEAAKSEPGKLSLGSPGPGSSLHLVFEGFKQLTKVDMTYVPYQGTGPAVTATLGGHVSAVLSDFGSLAPQLQSGDLRPLATATATGKRAAELPDIQTFHEAGLPGIGLESWFGIVAPAKLPEGAAKRFIGWYQEALKSKEATSKLVALRLTPTPICGDDHGQFLKTTSDAFGRIIKSANIQMK